MSQEQQQQQQAAEGGDAQQENNGAAAAGGVDYAFSEDEDEDGAAFDYAPEEGEEEEDWGEDLDMDEDEGEWVEEGLLDSEGSEPEEDDEDDAWLEDEEDEYLQPEQRVRLECGILEHDAHFFTSDAPRRHSHVSSSTCHHQTADAITFLPRQAGYTSADAAAQAAGLAGVPAGGRAGLGCSGSSSSSTRPLSHAGDGAVEEVVVSHRTLLNIWQLAPGQPAKLMARCDTAFKHYSIAASPCGNFVAASGNNGLLRLFRVQRGSSQDAAAQQTPAAAAHAAAKRAAGGSGSGAAAAALLWRFVHEATLLCAAGRETMVNSVRFGSFAGQPRLLVAHQDGMLYMFNLPGSQTNAAAAAADDATNASAAAAAAGSAAQQSAASGRAGAAVPGSELMVRGLPSWEPLPSQIFRRFVEAILSTLEEQQQLWGLQSQLEQQQGAGDAQEQQQQRHQTADEIVAAIKKLLRGEPAAMQAAEAAAAIRDSRQAAAAMQAAEAAEAAAATRDSRQAANEQQQQQREQPPELWMAGEMSAAMQGAPGSAEQAEAAIAAGERLLGFAVCQLAHNCAAAAELNPKFESGSGQQLHCMCSWEQRARHVAQLLQDAEFLKGFERLQQLRLVCSDPSFNIRMLSTIKGYWPAVEALRLAAPGQQAMLGLLGSQQQQRQWQRQRQQDDDAGSSASELKPGDANFGAALGRAAYLLLLLQLLAPCSVPVMKASARVLLLKYGPDVDPSVRPVSADIAAAPRLATCALSNVAICAAAAQAARAAQAQANAAAAAAAAEGAGPAVMAAAQIAVHDAMIAASQQCLPLNICECSPDGRWLAVGVDQAAVLLIPAGVGYQHQACRVLDLCPLLSPRMGAPGHQGTLGCQYVAFNSSSSLLAATSDHLRLSSVFDVASGQLVATFGLHNRALLPVRFVSAASNEAPQAPQQQQQQQEQQQAMHSAADGAVQLLPAPGSQPSGSSGSSSWGDRLLVYCEINGGVHIADLSTSKAGKGSAAAGGNRRKFYLKSYFELPAADAAPGQQQQQLPAQQQQQHPDEAEAMLDAAFDGGGGAGGAAAAAAAEQRINGLAVTPAGRVVVACQAGLMEWQLLVGWSHSTHARFPRRLKNAVKLLLLAAASTSSTSAAESSGSSGSNGSSSTQLLAQLPGVVLEQVIAEAALPQGCWADAKTPTQQQLEAALRARPGPAQEPVHPLQLHPMQLGMVLQQMAMQGGGGGGGGGPV